jgi:hypothetical protein
MLQEVHEEAWLPACLRLLSKLPKAHPPHGLGAGKWGQAGRRGRRAGRNFKGGAQQGSPVALQTAACLLPAAHPLCQLSPCLLKAQGMQCKLMAGCSSPPPPTTWPVRLQWVEPNRCVMDCFSYFAKYQEYYRLAVRRRGKRRQPARRAPGQLSPVPGRLPLLPRQPYSPLPMPCPTQSSFPHTAQRMCKPSTLMPHWMHPSASSVERRR